jgi:hypothetical protein
MSKAIVNRAAKAIGSRDIGSGAREELADQGEHNAKSVRPDVQKHIGFQERNKAEEKRKKIRRKKEKVCQLCRNG